MKKLVHNRTATAQHPNRNRLIIGRLLTLLAFGLFVGFAVRFAYIGLGGRVDSANLSTYREHQYATNTTLKAKRGAIFDRNGAVIAEDSSTYSVYAVLDHSYMNGKKKLYVTDKAHVAKVLAKYLPLSEARILEYLNPAKKAYQVEFGNAGKGLSLTVRNQIQAEHLTGVYFTDSPARLYPNGIFASHVVGLAQAQTSQQSTQLVGVMGLEKQFNSLLTGTNGFKSAQTDPYGYQLPASKTKVKPAGNGGTVTTTLDAGLQSYLETLMSSVQTKYAPKSMTAVLMNPKTGEILAASQRPTFDPSTKKGLGNMWRDALVEDVYEPGSVMKIFTLAAAIQTGTYQPNAYYHSGSVKVADRTIYDWQTSGWGSIPIGQAFPRSSNVGMVKIEQGMGGKNWATYLNKFGFAKRTDVTLPGEVAGTYDLKSPLNQAMTSFGQSIDVTVMQMMQGVTTVANRGPMVQPRIVKSVTTKNGKTVTYGRKVVRQPISKDTANQVVDAMRQVVNASYGTGMAYKMPGVDLAVKTGTAQIASPAGGYLTGDSNYIFSVMGMAPASNPKYVLYITMKQPQKMTKAAETIMASIFKPMMTRALALAGSGAAVPTTKTVAVPPVTGASASAASTSLKTAGLLAATVGTGNRIVQQLPAANTNALAGSRVLMLTNGAMTMPNVAGWAKSDVLKLAQLTGRKFSLQGDGYAVSQSVKTGALLGNGSVTVKFE